MLPPDVSTGTLSLVGEGFSFPTSVTCDEAGMIYVAESGLPFGGAPPGGRVWRLAPDGHRRLLPDGKLYFSQGAMTNTGIVGLDSYELGWLRRLPHAHDVPGYDLVLAGVNVETANPLSDEPDARAQTGAFVPFGVRTQPGQRIAAGLPCTAAVMRCKPDGSQLELVAWGLRNAYGIGFLPDGRLLAIDQGADDRGSRPVGNAPDLLFEVRTGAWYGWPDFIGADSITDPQYRPERGPVPSFVLANHDDLPPPERPLVRFPPHSAAVKFDVAPHSVQGWAG
jgi:hypothetical protein